MSELLKIADYGVAIVSLFLLGNTFFLWREIMKNNNRSKITIEQIENLILKNTQEEYRILLELKGCIKELQKVIEKQNQILLTLIEKEMKK